MRKLAMLLAAILTVELAAPAATAYAAPVETVTETVANEVTESTEEVEISSQAESSVEESEENESMVVETVESSEEESESVESGEEVSEVESSEVESSEMEETIVETTEEVTETTIEETTTEELTTEELTLEATLAAVSLASEYPDAEDLGTVTGYGQETYYKTSKGYPLVAAVKFPVKLTGNDYFYNKPVIERLTFAIDGGIAKEITVTKSDIAGEQDKVTYEFESVNIGFNAGYDKTLSAGEHTLVYEAVVKFNDKYYLLNSTVTADFVDEISDKALVQQATTQYMSAYGGSKVKMVYGFIYTASKSEKISSMVMYEHGTMNKIAYTTSDKYTYSGNTTIDSRYTEMGGVSIWSLFNRDSYYASYMCTITLKNDIKECDYDIVYTTSTGRKCTVENAYRATKQTIVYDAQSTGITSKNSTYDAIPVYSDNTGDYVSLFVYGLNLTKDNVPTFYNADKSVALTEYVTDDVMCGNEEWEYGFDYTLKKKDASGGDWVINSYYPVLVSGDALYVKNYSVEEKETTFYYGYSDTFERHELNTYAENFRVYLAPTGVTEEDYVEAKAYEDYSKDPLTVEAKVQYDGKNYYAEFDKDSIVYQAIEDNYWRILFNIKGQDSTYTVWVGGINKPKVVGNITVPANHSWEVHSVSDVANPIYSGTTTTKKNVLTASQVSKLEGKGLHRICTYKANGVVANRYLAYFKGETLYKINYEVNGGENHPDNPTEYGKSDTYTLLAPTKECHTFAGWYSDSKLTKKVTKIAKGSTGEKTFYAKWTPNKYTLTYNANGGKGNAVTKTYAYNEEVTIAKNTFTRTGYVFAGWSAAKDGGVTYAEDTIVEPFTTENGVKVQLYAVWEPIKYKLVLDKNSADAVDGTVEADANSFDVVYGDAYVLTGEEYARTGYEITSWNTKADGKGKKLVNGNVSNLTTVSGNTVTLYAQWAIDKYKITYNYDGGKVKKANPKTYTYNMSSDIILNPPEKKGYVFEGYYEVDPKSDAFTENETPVEKIIKGSTGDKIFYAKFRPVAYMIIFKDTTGAVFQEGITEESIEQPMKYGDMLTFTDAYYQKKGYTLVSWNTKENGKGKKYLSGKGYSNLTTEDGAEITVYAQWKKDSYSITYNLNGGKNDNKNPKKYSVDTNTITLKDPVKTGYTFDGWFVVDENGQITEERKSDIEKGSTGNLVLEAKWTPMTYNIVLNPNNRDYPDIECADGVELETIAYNADISPEDWNTKVYPSEMWKNKGIGILYWSTKANGSGKKYYLGKSYSGLAKEGTVTLYAKWGMAKYAINYVGAEGVKNANPATFTYDESKTITLKNISKKGYTFKGWCSVDPNAAEFDRKQHILTSISRGTCEDITLYAWFEPITYKIVLNPNGSDVVAKENLVTTIDATYGVAYTLEADAYTREHYQFKYWTTKANGKGTKVELTGGDVPLTMKKDTTVNLYPKWELIPYTITYHRAEFDGEKVVNKNPATYTYNTRKDVQLKNPTRAGYVFGGWYVENILEEGFDVSKATPVKKIPRGTAGDIELYAYWTSIRYNIQLDANAKDAKSGSITIKGENEKNNISYGEVVYLPGDAYSREGYNLVEFNTKKNGKGTSYALDASHQIKVTKANSTTKLYAIWEKVKTEKVSAVELSADAGTITVQFAVNEGCSQYEAALSPYFTMTSAVTQTVDSGTVVFEGLESGKRYFVRVREIRYDSNGNAVKGAWSGLKTIKTTE